MTELSALKSHKGLKFCHLNVRSVLGKFDQLKQDLLDSEIEVFSMSETWLNRGIDSTILHIDGYVLLRVDRDNSDNTHNCKSTGGGLCTYVREGLTCDSSSYQDLNGSNRNIELQFLELNFPHSKNILLVNVYRPPDGNVEEAVDEITQKMDSIQHIDKKKILIMGDFNIDYAKGTQPSTRKLKSLQQLYGLDQKVSGTTRNTSKSRTQIGFSGGSYRNYSYEQLLELIATKNLEPFMTENDPEKCWSMLYKLIIELADKLCPVRNYRVKSNKPQWLTREVLEAQKDRDYLYSKAMSTGDEGHDQMKRFLEDTEFLVKTQHGFRKGHSTTSAFSELIDDLLMNLDNSMITVALYLDFKKAFDTLNHRILLDKLSLAGFSPLTCRLIQNYLSNRKQTVLLNGRRSKERSLTTGCTPGLYAWVIIVSFVYQ